MVVTSLLSATSPSPRLSSEDSWLAGTTLSLPRRLLAEDLLGSSEDDSWDEDGGSERPLTQLDLARLLQEHRMERKLRRQHRLNPAVGYVICA